MCYLSLPKVHKYHARHYTAAFHEVFDNPFSSHCLQIMYMSSDPSLHVSSIIKKGTLVILDANAVIIKVDNNNNTNSKKLLTVGRTFRFILEVNIVP